MSEKPQIYVYLTTGGMLEWVVTRGEIDVIQVDWDDIKRAWDTDLDDLRAKRAELATIADEKVRQLALDDIDGFIYEREELDRLERERASRAYQSRLESARRLLRDAGELP